VNLGALIHVGGGAPRPPPPPHKGRDSELADAYETAIVIV
jgi:hypothetical protein